jgi:hypothetical protein
MPFYSWTRKAIPLILEGIVMNPHKIMAYPKVMSAVQEQNGIDSSVSDPWPDDQLFPDWLSGNVIGPVIPPDSGFARAIARSPAEVGYAMVNPTTPADQIFNDWGSHPLNTAVNGLTPFAKIPAELATKTEVMTGAPIKDWTQYADKNIPLLSTFSRITNGALGTGLKNKETTPANTAALLNFLTGAGILDTGRYIKGGEFDLKARMAAQQQKGG